MSNKSPLEISHNIKVYILLVSIFSVLIATGNMIFQKIVNIHIYGYHTLHISAGSLIYPLVFFVTDLVAELYGRKNANFMVKTGVMTNILIALIVWAIGYIETAQWSGITKHEYDKIFGIFGLAMLSSIFVTYISQKIDISIYLFLKKITGEKYLWLRSNVSTIFSQLVDTLAVTLILSLINDLIDQNFWTLAISSFLFKTVFTVVITPLYYLAVGTVRKA